MTTRSTIGRTTGTRKHVRAKALVARGFSLVEALVAFSVLLVVLYGALSFLQINTRLASAQMGVTELQQTARGARGELLEMMRTLGRGGLPAGLAQNQVPADPNRPDRRLPRGLSLDVLDDVDPADPDVPFDDVVAGTDILRIRGVLSTPVYQLDPAADDVFFPLDDGASGATLVLGEVGPAGVPQDLGPFEELIEAAQDAADPLIVYEPLLVVGADSETWAVVELDPANSFFGADDDGRRIVQLRFYYHDADNPDATDDRAAYDYASLGAGGVFPAQLFEMGIISVGILEEYAYWVREERAVPGDPASEWAPRLVRSRFRPASDEPWADDAANLRVDLAYHVLDLQVALGFDTPLLGTWDSDEDNVGEDDSIAETADGEADDWLWNAAADRADQPPWTTLAPEDLYYLRLSFLLRSRSRDPEHLSPILRGIENHAYGDGHALNSLDQRRFRRHVHTSVIDMRNL